MVIGIGGVSRSGKSTLAGKLKNEFEQRGNSVQVLSLDNYVNPKTSLPKIREIPDWEHPESINWGELHEAIDHSTTDILIIEGLFAFYPASFRSRYDHKIFMEIDMETFKKRRSEETRWGKEPAWYPDHVWESYLKFGRIKGDPDEYRVFPGDKPYRTTSIVEKMSN